MNLELGVGHCGFIKNPLISLINNCKQRFIYGNFLPYGGKPQTASYTKIIHFMKGPNHKHF